MNTMNTGGGNIRKLLGMQKIKYSEKKKDMSRIKIAKNKMCCSKCLKIIQKGERFAVQMTMEGTYALCLKCDDEVHTEIKSRKYSR